MLLVFFPCVGGWNSNFWLHYCVFVISLIVSGVNQTQHSPIFFLRVLLSCWLSLFSSVHYELLKHYCITALSTVIPVFCSIIKGVFTERPPLLITFTQDTQVYNDCSIMYWIWGVLLCAFVHKQVVFTLLMCILQDISFLIKGFVSQSWF